MSLCWLKADLDTAATWISQDRATFRRMPRLQEVGTIQPRDDTPNLSEGHPHPHREDGLRLIQVHLEPVLPGPLQHISFPYFQFTSSCAVVYEAACPCTRASVNLMACRYPQSLQEETTQASGRGSKIAP